MRHPVFLIDGWFDLSPVTILHYIKIRVPNLAVLGFGLTRSD